MKLIHYFTISTHSQNFNHQDNTRNHGPGGQTAYKVKSEADPCFAKVVEGFDAVDRMHLLSVEKGDYQRLKNYVAIKKMTILKD